MPLKDLIRPRFKLAFPLRKNLRNRNERNHLLDAIKAITFSDEEDEVSAKERPKIKDPPPVPPPLGMYLTFSDIRYL